MTPSPRSSSEQQAIQGQMDRFIAAWNRHDPKAMTALWAEDGDLINPFGRVAKSRGEVEKLIREEHATGLRDTQFSAQTERIRMFGPNVAVADYAYGITGKEANIQGHLTLVLEKRADTWEVVAARPMIPAPQPK